MRGIRHTQQKSKAFMLLLVASFFALQVNAYVETQTGHFVGGLFNNQSSFTYQNIASLGFRITESGQHYQDILTDPDYHVVRYNQVIALDYSRVNKSDVKGNEWQLVVYYTMTDLVTLTSISDTLTISDKNYQDVNIYSLPSGNWMIKINSIATAGTGFNSKVQADIRLLPKTEIEYYRDLSGVNLVYPTTPMSVNTTTDELNMKWNAISGVDEYELQYVFIDSQDINYYVFASGFSSRAFDHLIPSSTTVTEGLHYIEPVNVIVKPSISAIQEYRIHRTNPKGIMVMRVRPLSRMFDNFEVVQYGDWSGAYPYYTFTTDFEGDKFWSSVTTYAEEGKHKEIVSYMDGSMRGRQTITNSSNGSNSPFQDYTVVAETKYDYEGKAVLNTMPAVLNQHSIQYLPQFSKSSASVEFGKDNYDMLDHTASDTMFSGSGAAAYYSPNVLNEFSNKPMMQFVPDAYGYAYSQVEYIRDGTGRIRASGSTGADHQIKGGKDTRYFYGTTTQTQLKKLFGKNVGDAKHYKKNYVVDPNGQVSVAYLDQESRTVATALAGTSPVNVIGLNENAVHNMTESLMDKNVIDTIDKVSYLSHIFVNVVPSTTYQFTYDLRGVINKLDSSFCRGCAYELRIYITDQDGNYVDLTPTGGSADSMITASFDGGEIANCSISPDYFDTTALTFAATLPNVGEYKLVKELRMTDGAIEEFAEWLQENYTGFPDRDFLLADYLSRVDTSICDLSCTGAFKASCIVELSSDTATHWDSLTVAEQDELVDQCITDRCNGMISKAIDSCSVSECASYLTQMKESIVPNVNGFLNYHWWEGSSFADLHLISPIDSSAVTVRQDSLVDSLFLVDWIVDTLVYYHREYCHYTRCIGRLAADTFESQLSIRYTFEEAKRSNPNYYRIVIGFDSATNYLQYDPFFGIGGQGHSYIVSMDSDLHHYKNCTPPNNRTIEEYYSFSTSLYPCEGAGTPLSQNNAEIFYAGLSWPVDSDKIKKRHWQLMRSSYLDVRNKYIKMAEEADSCPYFDEDYAIVKDPTGGLPTNQADATDFIESNQSQDAGHTCLGNLMAWRLKLINECGVSDSDFNIHISYHLLNYCSRHFGPSNPLGLLFREDVPTDPDLAAVHTYLSGCDSNITMFNPYVYTVDSLYYYNDSTYGGIGENPIDSYSVAHLDTQCYIKPCLMALFNFVNYELCDTCYWGTCPLTPVPIPQILFPSVYSCTSYGLDSNEITVTLTDSIMLIVNGSCPTSLFFLNDSGKIIHGIYRVENFKYEKDRCDSCPYPSIYSKITATIYTHQPPYQQKAWMYVYCIDSLAQKCCLNFSYCVTDTIALGFNNDSAYVGGAVSMEGYYDTCVAQLREQAEYFGNLEYEQEYSAISSNLLLSLNKCFADPFHEDFYVTYPASEYHYTLYYYDQGGNLVQTVPPEGVDTLPPAAFTNGVWNSTFNPNHRLKTRYRHNSLNAVRWQKTPDTGDSSAFYYDSKGMLKISQNAKQQPLHQYSFTNYDEQGRIINVGQVEATSAINISRGMLDQQDFLTRFQPTTYPNFLTNVTDYTLTAYDQPMSVFNVNPRGRVTNSWRFENMMDFVALVFGANLSGNYSNTSYAYDVHGNVKMLLQKLPKTNALNFVGYQYDLLSGKVNRVDFGSSSVVRFSHRYAYDADNRLRTVETSKKGIVWENDANYYYYPHGPLARTELGNDQVQGLDYFYTIQGWLKGINGISTSASVDPGRDGTNINLYGQAMHPRFARDEYSLALGYYQGDYHPVGNNTLPITGSSAWSSYTADLQPAIGSKYGLFNGNIALMAVNIANSLKEDSVFPNHIQTMVYKYDQLNRIKKAVAYDSIGGTVKSYVGGSAPFEERYTYDMNGNITTLVRYDRYQKLDGLAYMYDKEDNGSSHWLISNRLYHFTDEVLSGVSNTDLDNPPGTWNSTNSTINGTNNFGYDAIGNLTRDSLEEIDTIIWDVYGKMKKLQRVTGSTKSDLEFMYDASGNRILKTEITKDTSGNINPSTGWAFTFYVRDATGNIMDVIYRAANGGSTVTEEMSIYGSSRIGVWKPAAPTNAYGIGLTALGADSRLMGQKNYELTNHLGNVMVTVSDKKEGVDSFTTNSHGVITGAGADNKAEYYLAGIASAQDYYPGGSVMPERNWQSNTYRFGFNNKEKDDEVAGNGNQYDYGFRIYNPRLGRFLSVDPLYRKFPWWTPYQFAGNIPTRYVDLDGLEAVDQQTGKVIDEFGNNGKASTSKAAEKKQETYFEHFSGMKIEDIKFVKGEASFIDIHDKNNDLIGSFQTDQKELKGITPGEAIPTLTMLSLLEYNRNSTYGGDGNPNAKSGEKQYGQTKANEMLKSFMNILTGRTLDGQPYWSATYDWSNNPQGKDNQTITQIDVINAYNVATTWRRELSLGYKLENIKPLIGPLSKPKVDPVIDALNTGYSQDPGGNSGE